MAQILFKVSEEIKSSYERCASSSGMNLSEWLRGLADACVSGSPGVAAAGEVPPSEILEELRRLSGLVAGLYPTVLVTPGPVANMDDTRAAILERSGDPTALFKENNEALMEATGKVFFGEKGSGKKSRSALPKLTGSRAAADVAREVNAVLPGGSVCLGGDVLPIQCVNKDLSPPPVPDFNYTGVKKFLMGRWMYEVRMETGGLRWVGVGP